MSERDHPRDNESQADNLRAVILTALTTDADRSGRLVAVRRVYEATPETPLERNEDLVARIVGPALDADRTGKTPEGTEAEAAALAAKLIAARPAEPCPALVKNLPRSLPEALIQYSPDVADGALLVAGTVTVISGAGGVGKSRLALQLAMTGAGVAPGAWASTGFGLDVRGGPVLMAGYEDDPGVVRWRSGRTSICPASNRGWPGVAPRVHAGCRPRQTWAHPLRASTGTARTRRPPGVCTVARGAHAGWRARATRCGRQVERRAPIRTARCGARRDRLSRARHRRRSTGRRHGGDRQAGSRRPRPRSRPGDPRLCTFL